MAVPFPSVDFRRTCHAKSAEESGQTALSLLPCVEPGLWGDQLGELVAHSITLLLFNPALKLPKLEALLTFFHMGVRYALASHGDFGFCPLAVRLQ